MRPGGPGRQGGALPQRAREGPLSHLQDEGTAGSGSPGHGVAAPPVEGIVASLSGRFASARLMAISEPSVDHIGELSLMPSKSDVFVKLIDSVPSARTAHTSDPNKNICLVKAMRDPSGDQAGSRARAVASVRLVRLTGPVPSGAMVQMSSAHATSNIGRIRQTLRDRREKAMRLPSGDQVGWSPIWPWVNRARSDPSEFITAMELPDWKTMRVPSGDQAGLVPTAIRFGVEPSEFITKISLPPCRTVSNTILDRSGFHRPFSPSELGVRSTTVEPSVLYRCGVPGPPQNKSTSGGATRGLQSTVNVVAGPEAKATVIDRGRARARTCSGDQSPH
jgi:hypothetical protein